MGRLPRFIPPGSLVEITARTIRGRFLLRPGPEMNAAILGTLGRALDLFPVTMHAFAFLSNHWHALVTVPDGESLSAFLDHVHGNIARAAQRIHGWTEPVWKRRAQTIVVVDDGAADARLRYILAHGAKEGLVSSPLDWPGVSSVRALAFGEPLVGYWTDGRRAAQLRRRGQAPRSDEIVTAYPINLAPLPGWWGDAVHVQQRRVRAWIREIERDASRCHAHVLGVVEVLRQDPHGQPQELEPSQAPVVHASTTSARADFVRKRCAFLDSYRRSSSELRAEPIERFPAFCFAPAPGFVRDAGTRSVHHRTIPARAAPTRGQRATDMASASGS
jgi:hypothetical protein